MKMGTCLCTCITTLCVICLYLCKLNSTRGLTIHKHAVHGFPYKGGPGVWFFHQICRYYVTCRVDDGPSKGTRSKEGMKCRISPQLQRLYAPRTVKMLTRYSRISLFSQMCRRCYVVAQSHHKQWWKEEPIHTKLMVNCFNMCLKCLRDLLIFFVWSTSGQFGTHNMFWTLPSHMLVCDEIYSNSCLLSWMIDNSIHIYMTVVS